MSVFEIDFTRAAIEWYGAPKEYEKGGVRLRHHNLNGRCDHYFHKAFEIGEITAPVLTIDRETWMSLTPMEIQSAVVPIDLAEGRVGTGGLGMGYFALAAAQKEEVSEVIVFERNPEVIRYFTDTFSGRLGFDKIRIVQGDMRELCRDYEFDLLFVDIYKDMLETSILKDIELFTDMNSIDTYRFWGQELVYFHAAIDDLVKLEKGESYPGLTYYDRNLFTDFFAGEERVGLRKEWHGDDFIVRAIGTLQDCT